MRLFMFISCAIFTEDTRRENDQSRKRLWRGSKLARAELGEGYTRRANRRCTAMPCGREGRGGRRRRARGKGGEVRGGAGVAHPPKHRAASTSWPQPAGGRERGRRPGGQEGNDMAHPGQTLSPRGNPSPPLPVGSANLLRRRSSLGGGSTLLRRRSRLRRLRRLLLGGGLHLCKAGGSASAREAEGARL